MIDKLVGLLIVVGMYMAISVASCAFIAIIENLIHKEEK